MADSSGPRGGGAIVALCVLAGAAAGVVAGQPTIGILAGTGVGTGLAIAVWLKDRRSK